MWNQCVYAPFWVLGIFAEESWSQVLLALLPCWWGTRNFKTLQWADMNFYVGHLQVITMSLFPWTLSLSCLALQGQLQGEALSVPSNCSWAKKSVLHEVDSFWFLYSSHQNLPLYYPFLSGSWTHCTFFSWPWCILVLPFGEQRVGQCQSNILESWLSSIFFCDPQ